MKITFTISPRNTSFPVLIINNLDAQLMPSKPGESIYSPVFTARPVDTQKGKLDISGVIRGKANAEVDVVIEAYKYGSTKEPETIKIHGTYSNRGNFIFFTSVSLPKSGFRGEEYKIRTPSNLFKLSTTSPPPNILVFVFPHSQVYTDTSRKAMQEALYLSNYHQLTDQHSISALRCFLALYIRSSVHRSRIVQMSIRD